MTPQVLVADDDDSIRSALALLLKSEGFTPTCVASPRAVLEAIKTTQFDLALLDLNYSLDTTSGEEGLALIKSFRHHDEITPIAVMTGWGSIEVAVQAMKSGADDFIEKPWDNGRLLVLIRNQCKLAALRRQTQRLTQRAHLLEQEISDDVELIAESPVMQSLLETLQRVGSTDASILLTGETGTGKSMFARYIYRHSRRNTEPFIRVNMGAITESLFESEMFGHEKGAFTDAKTGRIGRFELADGGVLFLDEIGNTPLGQQGKLLRVLEESEFERVGSSKTQRVDVRLISATNKELLDSVARGEFRQDLYYRINTVQVKIPSLRARVADILPLARRFLRLLESKYGSPRRSISPSAAAALERYPWPGNVRELSHLMERAYILSRRETIEVDDLNLVSAGNARAPLGAATSASAELETFDQLERAIIEQRLQHFDGDALRAAQSLGLSRSAFYRRLDKLKR